MNTTIATMNPILVSSDEGKKVNVLGIPMVIRIRGSDTGGVVSVVESHDVTGGGPPPHIHHREDETFQVLQGEYEWTVGGKTFLAKGGSTIFAPRGVPHTYRYLGQTPGRLMCAVTPAGFEGFFEEIGGLTPTQQQDIPKVIETGISDYCSRKERAVSALTPRCRSSMMALAGRGCLPGTTRAAR